jgi:hypothetical protein
MTSSLDLRITVCGGGRERRGEIGRREDVVPGSLWI